MKIDKNVISRAHKNFKLKDYSPDDALGFKGGKEEAAAHIEKHGKKIAALQELLYANSSERLLIILQGMDTAGKDGTISHVFRYANPQGVRVACFKAPTRIEASRDYLWRVHLQAPAKGEIVIFNRSHYEDVLAVRVHNLVPKKIWEKRYGQINDFEKMLSEEGVKILKFFLHISKDEQTGRLRARLDAPEKQWKLSAADVKERQYWKDYQEAYEAVVSKTSTAHAPWHIVPANDKRIRNIFVSKAIVRALEGMKLKTPKPDYDPATMRKALEK